MDRQLADNLAQCLEQIEQQGKTVNEAISLFPEQAQELRALLETVNKVGRIANAAPRSEFVSVARIRLQNRIAAQETISTENSDVTFSPPRRHKLRKRQTIRRRLSMSWIIIIATVASLVLGGGGVAFASSDALPGDALYPAKTLIQDVGLALKGNESDIELLLDFMDGNIADMNQLAELGRWEDIAEGLDEYQENLSDLLKTRTRLSYLDAHNEDALTTRVQQELHLQSQELVKLQNKIQNREEIQNKIQEAIQQTDQGKINGPSEGSAPPEGGEPNGGGPGDPLGTQEQQRNGQPDNAGEPGNDNNQDGEGCRQQNQDTEEGLDQNPACGQEGGGNAGEGNGQGGKP